MAKLRRPDGAELHWGERGTGPLVVLATQFFGSPELFSGLIADLVTDHRVVWYHLRGTGNSTRRGPYRIDTDAEDLGAVIEEAGGPAVLVGTGDGCNRAVKLGAARQDLVRAVVTPAGNPVGRRAVEGTEGLAGSESVIEALLGMIDIDYRSALRTMLQTANPDLNETELTERVDRTVAFCPHKPGAERMREWAYSSVVDEGRALGDRLWILEHGRNLWFPIGVVSRTREFLPEAHVEEVPDGPITRPDITAAVVRRLTAPELVQQPSATAD